MDRQKLAIIVIIIGIPVFAVVMAKNLKPRKKKPRAPAVQVATVSVAQPQVVQPQQGDAKSLDAQKARAELAWGRDPFFSDPYKAGQASDLLLLGISYRADGKGFANINNEIVKQGDTVKGFQVKEVLKDKVLLNKGDQSFYLTFPEQ